jgi:hypothetical protein
MDLREPMNFVLGFPLVEATGQQKLESVALNYKPAQGSRKAPDRDVRRLEWFGKGR